MWGTSHPMIYIWPNRAHGKCFFSWYNPFNNNSPSTYRLRSKLYRNLGAINGSPCLKKLTCCSKNCSNIKGGDSMLPIECHSLVFQPRIQQKAKPLFFEYDNKVVWSNISLRSCPMFFSPLSSRDVQVQVENWGEWRAPEEALVHWKGGEKISKQSLLDAKFALQVIS